MKNTATNGQASGPGGRRTCPAGDAWAAALRRFDRDLQRRGTAERTRRAYGADVGELATWAAAQGLEPAAVTYRLLRAQAAADAPAHAEAGGRRRPARPHPRHHAARAARPRAVRARLRVRAARRG